LVVFPVKHFRIFIILLILVLLLSTCASTSGEPYTVSINSSQSVSVHPDSGTIQYGSDVYRYAVKSFLGRTRYILTYPDGQRCTWTESKKTGQGFWSEGCGPSLYLPGETLVEVLKQPVPESTGYLTFFREKHGNPVLGIFASLAGILLMVFHKWRADPDNPRKFVFWGRSRIGVEVSPEEHAAFIFVDGVLLLFFGLFQFFF
jgi:hypothetical protein